MPDWPSLAARVQVAAQRAVGEPYTYTPTSTGVPLARVGVFSEAHEQVELADGIAKSSVAPVLSVHLADLPVAPKRGDAVSVRGKSFTVFDVQPDGEGDADLELKKV